ncbi:hypothetical protein M879_19320 [Mycobacteroides abscessus V06705]|nr:hypothetical protein M879_19320 [Mycobacteroides abscessus V06705]
MHGASCGNIDSKIVVAQRKHQNQVPSNIADTFVAVFSRPTPGGFFVTVT